MPVQLLPGRGIAGHRVGSGVEVGLRVGDSVGVLVAVFVGTGVEVGARVAVALGVTVRS